MVNISGTKDIGLRKALILLLRLKTLNMNQMMNLVVTDQNPAMSKFARQRRKLQAS